MFDKYLTKTGLLSKSQPQDVKNQWYIQKFQEVHGTRYDYSKVVYKTTREKVIIICKEHGEFWQTPNSHLNGRGCPQCSPSQKKTTAKCIEDFIQVHGSTYDYSNVVYVHSHTEVQIICREHGVFLQRPDAHLEGNGCPKCGDNKIQNTKLKSVEECIQDFKKIHGETYNYSQVQYNNCRTKVEIICKEHGSFFQTPNNHLRGHGCPKCQVSNQNTLYILKCLDTGLIKIGITNRLDKRISTIGGNLEYIHHITLENPRQLELELHKRYQQFRIFNPNVVSGGTEFFELSEQQIKALIEELKNEDNLQNPNQ